MSSLNCADFCINQPNLIFVLVIQHANISFGQFSMSGADVHTKAKLKQSSSHHKSAEPVHALVVNEWMNDPVSSHWSNPFTT